MSAQVGLDEVEVNSRVKVIQVDPQSRIRRRIMDMGIVRGTEITVSGKAPMGDPIELLVRGYNLSLRKSEAKDITVEVV
ncbi:FeoA family protein [Clostridium arbusti]|uniref:FeoA family protein n=1 Tax=Clostridium arbusti TaxID=1137848 RepID=UPI00028A00C4|nr:ferrous iron transport protein A [Clostridium arbusti]